MAKRKEDEEAAPLLHASACGASGAGGSNDPVETASAPREAVWLSFVMIAAGCLVLVIGAVPKLLHRYRSHHLPANANPVISQRHATTLATTRAGHSGEREPHTAHHAAVHAAHALDSTTWFKPAATTTPRRREGESQLHDPVTTHLKAPFDSLLPTPKDASGRLLSLDPGHKSWVPDDTWAHKPASSSSSSSSSIVGRKAGAPSSMFNVCVDGGTDLWNKAYVTDMSELFSRGYCFGDVIAPTMDVSKTVERVGPTRRSEEVDVAEPASGEENKRAYVACGAADVRLYDQYPTCFAGRYRREPRVAQISEWMDPTAAARFEAEAKENDKRFVASSSSSSVAALAASSAAAKVMKSVALDETTNVVVIDGADGMSGRSIVMRGGKPMRSAWEAEAESQSQAAMIASTEQQQSISTSSTESSLDKVIGSGRRRRRHRHLLMSASEKKATLAAAAEATVATPTAAAKLFTHSVPGTTSATPLAQQQQQQQQQQPVLQYVPVTYQIVKPPDVNSTYSFPPKAQNPRQATMYFAKEAPAICPELSAPSLSSNVDYLAYVGEEQSDVWWPYAPTLDTLARDFEAFMIPHGKRRPIAAFVHKHCGGVGGKVRSAFVQALALRFPVHSMGECHPNTEKPWAELPPRGESTAESQAALAKYMFYFALENADCDGYVTEKVWEVLSRGSIPVYYGSDDIYEYLPDPNAIIDVKKFATVDDLAAKMRQVANDPMVFAKMRAWRVADPTTWPEGFKRFLAVGHTDIRARVCGALRSGGKKRKGEEKNQRQQKINSNNNVEGEVVTSSTKERSPMLDRCVAKPLIGVEAPSYFDAPQTLGPAVLPRRWPELSLADGEGGGGGGDGEAARAVVRTHGDNVIVPAEAHFTRRCDDDDRRECYAWRDAETVRRALLGGGGESFLPTEMGGKGEKVTPPPLPPPPPPNAIAAAGLDSTGGGAAGSPSGGDVGVSSALDAYLWSGAEK